MTDGTRRLIGGLTLAGLLIGVGAGSRRRAPADRTGGWRPRSGLDSSTSSRPRRRRPLPAPGGSKSGSAPAPPRVAPASDRGSFGIDVYGPDGRTPNRAAVRAIRARGGSTICYVDAGTWESWRPDAARFPRHLRGRPNGWPGEHRLDIRQTGELLPLMAARVARCRSAGFEGGEVDNVDGFANATGFPLTSAQQLRYNRDLVALAHRQGLAAGLKHDLGQVRALPPAVDVAIDGQCAQYAECDRLRPFLAAHKAGFEIEYTLAPARFCPAAAGRSAGAKRPALRARPWTPCR